MFRAIKHNDIAKLKKEVFLGADINAKDVDGDTPIIKAIKSDRHSSFEFLLHNGANLLIEDSNGHNALD
ncbi:MAG: ankyrin repeat domain-containing protein, partial [Syntrophomonadaceae bacterium]